MSIFSRLAGQKYNDTKLLSQAQNAISSDPLMAEVTGVLVASEQGVIRLSGKVHRNFDKDRVENVIRTSLQTAGIKFERIENQVQVT